MTAGLSWQGRDWHSFVHPHPLGLRACPSCFPNKQLGSASPVADTVLRATAFMGKMGFYSHFTDEEAEAQNDEITLFKVPKLVSSNPRSASSQPTCPLLLYWGKSLCSPCGPGRRENQEENPWSAELSSLQSLRRMMTDRRRG